MKLVIFDLGETLVFYEGLGLSWKEHYQSALEKAFKKIDYQITLNELEYCKEILIFYNTREQHRIFEVKESEVLQRVAEVCNKRIDWQRFELEFFNYFKRKAKPEETAINTLEYLKQKGIGIAVLSDAAYGMPKDLLVNDLGDLQKLIDVVYSSTDIGFRKPHPKGIEKLIKQFESGKDQVLFVGNEKKDIEVAINAGVKSLLLSKSDEYKDFGQTATIRRLSEVQQYIV